MFDNLKKRFWAWVAEAGAVDPETCQHKWVVVCGVINEVAIQVQCKKCAIWGSVPDPSKEEWDKCVDAYENPYPWKESARVEFSLEATTE